MRPKAIKHSERVLLLTSESFNGVTGAGITMANLFAGWDNDSIASIHCDSRPVSRDVCSRYYLLTENEIARWGPLKYVLPKRSLHSMQISVRSSLVRSWALSILIRIKKIIFGDGVPQKARLSSELRAWIAEFRPTLLYTTLGSNAMMEIADQLRTKFNLPLVTHIMDDWTAVIYRGGLLSSFQRRKKERLLRHLIDASATRIAICKEMSDAYFARYGKSFEAFQNTVDFKAWSDPIPSIDIVASKPIRAVYVGSIHPSAQFDSLVDCCVGIQQMCDEGFAISLEIYSPQFGVNQYEEKLVVGAAISFSKAIADDRQYFELLRAADILILPVNFDPHSVKYIRYSMPTKIPAYLASGTPVLVYGPSTTAQISYAQREGWGLVVDSPNNELLRQGLKQIATDVSLRNRISDRARVCAANLHDVNTVRNKFQKMINNVSNCSMDCTGA